MAHRSASKKGPSQRQLRVGELIRHELAVIFTRGDVVDPVLEKLGVTVLEVSVAPDLKIATAYVRPFQMNGDGDELVAALQRHRKYIRGLLAPKLKLKFMPDIHFSSDASQDYAAHIDSILRKPAVARDLGPREED